MMDDHDSFTYFRNRRPDRAYLTRSFDSGSGKMRILRKVLDQEEQHSIATVKEEMVLRVSPGERVQLKAVFLEVGRSKHSLVLQRFRTKDGKPISNCFSLNEDELRDLRAFFEMIDDLHLESDDGQRIPWPRAAPLAMSTDVKREIIAQNPDLVEEVLKQRLTSRDVVALGYRKQQLEVFEGLLRSREFFQSRKSKWGKLRDEDVWQHYFENNKWVFGYGLNYLWLSSLDDRKLEQVVAGYTFNQSGKRVDALLKTRGIINSLCFVEIKTHKTPLLCQQATPYRPECWAISSELAGSVAQIQMTVHKAVTSIAGRTRLTDRSGDPTTEDVFCYQPKAYLVVGNLAEFQTENGVNEAKFRSFEIWRQDHKSIEVLTFDELFERAKSIICSEGEVLEDMAA
jgi:hypothetical protein